MRLASMLPLSAWAGVTTILLAGLPQVASAGPAAARPAPATAAAGPAPAPPRAAPEVPPVAKLAVVDLQKILLSTKQGKRTKTKLEGEIKAKQGQIDGKRAKLENEVGKLRNLSGDALRKAQEDLQRQSGELQQEAMTFDQDLAQKESALLEEIYGNVQAILDKISTEQGIDLVLVRDQMTVMWVEAGMDLTLEVIKRYDEKHK